MIVVLKCVAVIGHPVDVKITLHEWKNIQGHFNGIIAIMSDR